MGNYFEVKTNFFEFDDDGNRNMELDEMQEIFESNKISASINDLVDLFFKRKKFKESEIMKLNKEKEKIKIVNKVKILEENNKKKMMKKKENTFR